MSTAWIAAFVLLCILNVAIVVVLIALMRQIGVLHQRVKPTGPGTQEGPEPGFELPLVSMEPVDADPPPDKQPFGVPVTVLAYVNPGCTVCAELPHFVRSLLRHIDGEDLVMAFVTDSPMEAARHYAAENDLPVPLFQAGGLARAWGLPGSPYVIAVSVASSSSVRVLACGVVNTLEQLEDLVGAAVEQPAFLPLRDEVVPGDGWTEGRLTVMHSGGSAAATAQQQEAEQ